MTMEGGKSPELNSWIKRQIEKMSYVAKPRGVVMGASSTVFLP